MSYISLDEAELFLFPRGDCPKEIEGYIQAELETVSRLIDERVGYSFALGPENETRYYDGRGKPYLYIDPLDTLVSVQYAYDWDPATWNTLDLQYLATKGNPIFFLAIRTNCPTIGIFPAGTQNIKITGRWGYATIPTAIKTAAKLLLVRLLNQSEQFRSMYFRDALAAEQNPSIFAEKGSLWNGIIEGLIFPYVRHNLR